MPAIACNTPLLDAARMLRGHRAQGAGVPEATGFVRMGVNSEQKDSQWTCPPLLKSYSCPPPLIHFRFPCSQSKLPSDSFVIHLHLISN